MHPCLHVTSWRIEKWLDCRLLFWNTLKHWNEVKYWLEMSQNAWVYKKMQIGFSFYLFGLFFFVPLIASSAVWKHFTLKTFLSFSFTSIFTLHIIFPQWQLFLNLLVTNRIFRIVTFSIYTAPNISFKSKTIFRKRTLILYIKKNNIESAFRKHLEKRLK